MTDALDVMVTDDERVSVTVRDIEMESEAVLDAVAVVVLDPLLLYVADEDFVAVTVSVAERVDVIESDCVRVTDEDLVEVTVTEGESVEDEDACNLRSCLSSPTAGQHSLVMVSLIDSNMVLRSPLPTASAHAE